LGMSAVLGLFKRERRNLGRAARQEGLVVLKVGEDGVGGEPFVVGDEKAGHVGGLGLQDELLLAAPHEVPHVVLVSETIEVHQLPNAPAAVILVLGAVAIL